MLMVGKLLCSHKHTNSVSEYHSNPCTFFFGPGFAGVAGFLTGDPFSEDFFGVDFAEEPLFAFSLFCASFSLFSTSSLRGRPRGRFSFGSFVRGRPRLRFVGLSAWQLLWLLLWDFEGDFNDDFDGDPLRDASGMLSSSDEEISIEFSLDGLSFFSCESGFSSWDESLSESFLFRGVEGFFFGECLLGESVLFDLPSFLLGLFDTLFLGLEEGVEELVFLLSSLLAFLGGGLAPTLFLLRLAFLDASSKALCPNSAIWKRYSKYFDKNSNNVICSKKRHITVSDQRSSSSRFIWKLTEHNTIYTNNASLIFYGPLANGGAINALTISGHRQPYLSDFNSLPFLRNPKAHTVRLPRIHLFIDTSRVSPIHA